MVPQSGTEAALLGVHLLSRYKREGMEESHAPSTHWWIWELWNQTVAQEASAVVAKEVCVQLFQERSQ